MKFTSAIITAFLGIAAASPMEQHHGGNKKGGVADAVSSAMGAVPTLPGKVLPMADDDIAMAMMDTRAPPPPAMGSPMEPEMPKGHEGHKKMGKGKDHDKRGDKKGGVMDAAGHASDAVDDLLDDAKGAAKGAEGTAKGAAKGIEGTAKGAAKGVQDAVGNL